MDELIQQGLVLIRQRKQQIAALKAELAKLAVQNARERTVNRAELMGVAWYRLNEARYMLALLEKRMRKLQRLVRHQPNQQSPPCPEVVDRMC